MKTQICSACGEEKSIEAYNWRSKKKGIRHKKCKECQKVYSKQHYQDNKTTYLKKARRWDAENAKVVRQYVIDYLLSHPCVDCGETDPVVLEFDHVRGKKEAALGDIARGKHSLKKVIREIAKCEVRCANCHRIKTAKQQGWMMLELYEEYLDKKA